MESNKLPQALVWPHLRESTRWCMVREPLPSEAAWEEGLGCPARSSCLLHNQVHWSQTLKTKACDPSKGCCPFLRFSIVLSTMRAFVLSRFSCLTLCDPVECSSPGSSVHGIFQARTLEWVAMLSSWGSSWPRDWTCVSCDSRIAGGFFITESWGKPMAHHSSSHFDSCLYSCSLFCMHVLAFFCLFRYKDVYWNTAMAIFLKKEFECHEWGNFQVFFSHSLNWIKEFLHSIMLYNFQKFHTDDFT